MPFPILPVILAAINLIGPKVIGGFIDHAEESFPGSGRGAEKKNWVMQTIEALYAIAKSEGKIPEGVQKNEALLFKMVGALIDRFVAAKKMGAQSAPPAA